MVAPGVHMYHLRQLKLPEQRCAQRGHSRHTQLRAVLALEPISRLSDQAVCLDRSPAPIMYGLLNAFTGGLMEEGECVQS